MAQLCVVDKESHFHRNTGFLFMSSSPNETRHHIKVSHIILTFVASVVVSAQSTVNAAMNEITKNPLVTALTVFFAGLVVTAVMTISRPEIRTAFVSVPSLVRAGNLKWWHLLGGFTGATFVAVQSGLVSVTGVAVFTVSVVAGQTAGALLVDKYGIGPAGKQAITFGRVASSLLGVVGVIVAITGGDSQHQIAIGGILASFAIGFIVCIQPALNGQVAIQSGQAIAATLVNFIAGLGMIAVIFAVTQLVNAQTYWLPPVPWENPWVWLGGPFGVFFVLTAARMASTLGVFVFTLTSVLGQLSGAILMDVLFPTSATDLTVRLFVGVAITGAAVVLASATSKPKTA